jgi:hypothetical protein
MSLHSLIQRLAQALLLHSDLVTAGDEISRGTQIDSMIDIRRRDDA